MQSVSILGSTGSIGRSALEVVDSYPDRFRVVALAAGRSVETLARQTVRYRPRLVAMATPEAASRLRAMLPAGTNVRIETGPSGLEEVAAFSDARIVVGGLVGALGLRSAYAAVRAGKRLALANKEPLVVAGELILKEAARTGAELLPVDSEHSAIHQAMRSGRREEVRRLILTASGGPFRERDLATFPAITVEDALAHPTWKMGPKITIDSATMMNKGLEIIEAHFLFGVPPHAIVPVIHPQSIIHSAVEFVDGSIVAQLAINDMKLPILYAMAYPDRLAADFGRLDLPVLRTLEFYAVEPDRYPAVELARDSLKSGGGAPAILNAANEIAVEAFLQGKISFPDIVSLVSETMAAARSVASPTTLEEAEEIDGLARRRARELMHRMSRAAVVH